jgi:hypothetical protein
MTAVIGLEIAIGLEIWVFYCLDNIFLRQTYRYWIQLPHTYSQIDVNGNGRCNTKKKKSRSIKETYVRGVGTKRPIRILISQGDCHLFSLRYVPRERQNLIEVMKKKTDLFLFFQVISCGYITFLSLFDKHRYKHAVID